MERLSQEQHRARINALAELMVKLYINDYRTPQSALYEATAQEYLQANVDLMYPNDPPGTHSHLTTG